MKVMFLLFLSVMIILLIIAVKQLKKTKLKQKKELFTRTIRECVKSYEEKEDFWRMLHDSFCDDLIDPEKNKLLKKIPQVKEHYKNAVKELVQISDNNTVLFTSQDEWDCLDKEIDFIQRDKKISDDIIQTLPYLSNFIEKHKFLVGEIYGYLKDITTLYDLVFAGLAYYDYESETEDFLREMYQRRFESCKKFSLDVYRNYVQEDGWKKIAETYPAYNTSSNMEIFIKTCEEDEEAYETWLQIWFDSFRREAFSRGYATLFSELRSYLEETNEEFGNPTWLEYPYVKFHLSVYSSFSLGDIDQIDSYELSRIRNLYIQGKMSGKYIQSNDPEYAK